MTARWLPDFPQHPQRVSFAIEDGDGRGQFQPELGPALGERRSSATPDVIYATFHFTVAQRALYKPWLDGDLAGGAKPFWAPAFDLGGQTLGSTESEAVVDEDGAAVGIDEWDFVAFARDQPLPKFSRNFSEYIGVFALWRLA